MSISFRAFKKVDYTQCEALVCKAWKLNLHFQPPALSELIQHLYTQGAVIHSNYFQVAESDGKVVGFIFGLNIHQPKPKPSIWFNLKIIWRLLSLNPIEPSSRKTILNAFAMHAKNREKLVKRTQSEITLFVVDKAFQGQGIGQALWKNFLSYCQTDSNKTILVETNTAGAATFYEHIGFKLVGEFDSPVHQFVEKQGNACLYEYYCK